MNIQFIMKKSMTIMLTLMILLSTVESAVAQENRRVQGRNVPAVPSQGQGHTDPAEMEAFLDGLLAKEMEENHGAAGRRYPDCDRPCWSLE